jgi:hypothetical protein
MCNPGGRGDVTDVNFPSRGRGESGPSPLGIWRLKADLTPGTGKNISQSIIWQRKIAISYFKMGTSPQGVVAWIIPSSPPGVVKILNVPQRYLQWIFSP